MNPDRSLWSAVSAVAALAALIVASIAVAQAGDDGSGPSLAGSGGPARPIAGVDTGGDDAGETSRGGEVPTTTLDVAMSEFAFAPAELEAPAGEVILRVVNEGAIPHNVWFEDLDARTDDLAGGESATLELGELEPGEYAFHCHVPGHASAGMEGVLTVTEGEGDAEPTTGGGRGDGTDYAALDRAMMESMKRFPAATEGTGARPLAPEVLGDGTLQFTLTAEIVDWEVAPGRIVESWTYNGQVPGPLIRAEVGDRLRVVVHNRLPMGTDVHWHGVSTPNEMDGVAPITQPLIEPGETFVYEFTATQATIGMYHAHHHAQMQVPNGLLGPIVIGDLALPHGRTVSGRSLPERIEVAQEFPMVLNDAGAVGYSLNGKSFPATAPVVAAPGDWLLVHYMNEGLQIHPMHLHQFAQLVVAKDGIPLDAPYWADTVNVAPGERYSVLVQATDPGTWVWHCHILSHVESEDGMFGMVTAVVVE